MIGGGSLAPAFPGPRFPAAGRGIENRCDDEDLPLTLSISSPAFD
jgi:hypothetical protein